MRMLFPLSFRRFSRLFSLCDFATAVVPSIENSKSSLSHIHDFISLVMVGVFCFLSCFLLFFLLLFLGLQSDRISYSSSDVPFLRSTAMKSPSPMVLCGRKR